MAGALSLSTSHLEARTRSELAASVGPIQHYSPRAVLPSDCTALLAAARIPVTYTLRSGETLAQVLHRLGLSGEEARQATSSLAEHVSLRALKAGNRYSAFFNSDSTLASVDLTLAGDGKAEMSRGDDGQWQLAWQPFRRSTVLRSLRATLDGSGSLEAAIHRAGGPSGLAYRMADALQWDLDFARDLRRGDRFELLYEAMQLDGKDHALGDLVALVYENQGKRHEVYRYGDATNFFDDEGRPLRKMFLRCPLRYTHITSFFSQSRLHPVLNEVRPHYGVDYSAPVGTPVQVTASGVVTFVGWDGGGGNVVKVQHGGDYVSAYLHLSRFASGLRPGAHVRQGDIIAFTGATGLATGPHLDYRVKFHGDWIDPLTLKGVRDEPVGAAQLAAFHTWRDTLRTSMTTGIVPADLVLPAHREPDTQLASLHSSRPPRSRRHTPRATGGTPAPALTSLAR
jgi:murein DD-endopeptidase MepM/ murein hydrolase activator NlpD